MRIVFLTRPSEILGGMYLHRSLLVLAGLGLTICGCHQENRVPGLDSVILADGIEIRVTSAKVTRKTQFPSSKSVVFEVEFEHEKNTHLWKKTPEFWVSSGNGLKAKLIEFIPNSGFRVSSGGAVTKGLSILVFSFPSAPEAPYRLHFDADSPVPLDRFFVDSKK